MFTRIDASGRMSQAFVHNGTAYPAGQVAAPGASVDEQTRAVLSAVEARWASMQIAGKPSNVSA